MTMSDQFYHFILFFFELHIVGPLIALGINFIDKRAFTYVALMVFLSAFVNIYLKSIWQIPLDPSFNRLGWSYPSGHTQFNVVLWLMILYNFRKLWLLLLIVPLFITSLFGMIHFHYHNWHDIIGGLISGCALFLIFPIWNYFFKNKELEFAIITLITSIILYLLLPVPPENYNWLFTYFGLNTGFVIYLTISRCGIDYVMNKSLKNHIPQAIAIIVCLLAINRLSYSGDIGHFIEGLAISLSMLIIVPMFFYKFNRYLNR